ncbi:hypothetical protein LZ554_004927 [Drepanopeziza brunnea f. sp. 'monogermtubi']|nr:hypothetical protein LZ554_004927 [Drepanopeziza brunnea f. sp. 'monogermtubi']
MESFVNDTSLKKAGKLNSFEILTVEYKNVGGAGVELDVLIPDSLPANTTAPLVVRFHGGGFVTGSSLYEDWFPLWVLELAAAENAIVVSANYRLLPESTGMDVMEDLDDLWAYLHSSLPDVLKKSKIEGVGVDLERIITAGDSAGGYMSVQFALNHSEKIKACTADFPGIDLDMPPMTAPSATPPPGPTLPLTYVEDHLASSPKGTVVSSDMTLARFPLIFAMMQQGTLHKYLGTDDRLFPFRRVEKGEKLPALFVVQGREDLIVSVESSKRFVELVKRKRAVRGGEKELVLSVTDGGHGMSCGWGVENEGLKEGLEMVKKVWLG